MPVESTPTLRLEDPPPLAPPAPPVADVALSRALVARGVDVEPLMRTAKSAIGELTGRLQAALDEAAAAEAAVGDLSHEAAVESEWNASLQVIREEIEERRARHAQDLDLARRDAAECMAAARAEASALVQAASNSLSESLSEGSRPTEPDPIIPGPVVPGPTDLPPAAAAEAPVTDVPPAPAPAPPPDASRALPAATLLSGMPPFVAVMVPSTDGSATPTYVLAPTVGMSSWAPGPSPQHTQMVPMPAAAFQAPAGYPGAPGYPEGHGYQPLPTSQPVPGYQPAPAPPIEGRHRASSGGRRSRLLHIDVILPLLAVAIVIVVLLAWLG